MRQPSADVADDATANVTEAPPRSNSAAAAMKKCYVHKVVGGVVVKAEHVAKP